MKKFELEIINNKLIKQIIEKLQLNENQIKSGIDVFQQIINEQNSSEELNYKTQVKIYDENNVIGIVVPSGEFKDKLSRNKYHKLSKITYLDPKIRFSKEKKATSSSLGNNFFWQLSDFTNTDRAQVAEWFKSFFKSLNDNKNKQKGFYLVGSFGVGKTTFMQAFANYLIEKQYSVCFVKINDLSNYFKKLFNDSESMNQSMEIIKNVDYLLIDDIGSEKVSEWLLQDILYPIIDYRLHKRKMTCYTSNHDYEELSNIYIKSKKIDSYNIERILDRIISATQEIRMEGENIKKLDIN